MKGLVEVIARALVDDPTPVEVHEVGPPDPGAGAEHVYRLKVGKDDLGKVIGKKGRTAKAFRTLLAAAAAKQNRKITLEILEPERPRRDPDANADADANPDANGDDDREARGDGKGRGARRNDAHEAQNEVNETNEVNEAGGERDASSEPS